MPPVLPAGPLTGIQHDHPAPRPGRPSRGRQPRRTRPDHRDIEPRHRATSPTTSPS